jgi:hypothetical protein
MEQDGNRSKLCEVVNDLKLKVGVEIGVATGLFSFLLLRDTKLEKLFCVDDYAVEIWGLSGVDNLQIAQKRLKKFGKRCTFLIKSSEDAASCFLDFYDIKKDIALWWSK